MTNYFITKKSTNKKTGPIPVSTTGRDTCPNSCPFKGNGCYAEGYPLKGRWDEVTDGRRGGSLDDMCATIATLPDGQLWRHNQAGDLPGNGHLIRKRDLQKIVKANAGKKGFTFTHYRAEIENNTNAIREANRNGFTINLSANDLNHADDLIDKEIGPVVVVLPADFAGRQTKTPNGHKVAQCPATYKETTCADCGLCAVRDRKVIVGFPAHGNGKRKANEIAAI